MSDTPRSDGFRETPHRGLITVAIMLAMVMQVLDMTIANIALPSMQASLGAAQDTISWVLTSYIVAAAIATPLTGWLAERIGRKRLFLICVAGFVVSSALCGSAQNLGQIVVYRILQGAFGAAMAPLSQAVLLDINPKERQGQAMALWGAGIMIGPIIGPTLGGWLTDALSWRWVFYINLPIGLLALAGMWFYLPETTKTDRKFDLFGFAFLALSIGALQLFLDRGEQLDWLQSTEILIEIGLFAAALWVFLVHSATADRPFLDPALFRDRNFVTALVFMFLIGTILLATMALLPPMMEHLMGYPTVETGLVLAPRGFGTMLSMLVVGRLVRRVDARILILFGLCMSAVSAWQMMGFTIVMGSSPIVVSGVIQGFGLGFVFIPLSTLAFATLAPQLRTEATSLFSLVRNLGSSIGISVMMAALSRTATITSTELAARVSPSGDMPVGGMFDANTFLSGTPQAIAWLKGEIMRQSTMVAYLNDFKLILIVTLCAMPLLLLLRPPRGDAPEPAHAMAE